MTDAGTATRHESIASSLLAMGWCVSADFLSAQEAAGLSVQAREYHRQGLFRSAAVGHGAGRQANAAIRGDETLWIEPSQEGRPSDVMLDRFEALRLDLNARCLLGLFDLEIHFARYAPGSRYARHLDRFRDDSARVLSCVLYLNDDWLPEHGGQLRLFTGEDEAAHVDVLPAAGTLVTFLSDRFAHEVLPARRERWSVTGWFRARQ